MHTGPIPLSNAFMILAGNSDEIQMRRFFSLSNMSINQPHQVQMHRYNVNVGVYSSMAVDGSHIEKTSSSSYLPSPLLKDVGRVQGVGYSIKRVKVAFAMLYNCLWDWKACKGIKMNVYIA